MAGLLAVTVLLAMAGGALAEDLDGPAFAYYENGQIRIAATFAEGRLTGLWTEFYENGQVKATGTASGSPRNDIFHPIRTGLWLEYSAGGVLTFMGEYDDDLLNGRAVWYHNNGEMAYEATFRDGYLSGPWTSYHDNGRVAATGTAYGNEFWRNTYDFALRTGTWREFNRQGVLVFEGTYVNHRLEGTAVWYHNNGAKRYEAVFRNGRLNGPWTSYHDNGQVRWTGMAVGNGFGLINSADFPLRDGTWREFNRQGTLVFEGTYVNDRLEGFAVRYFGNGQPEYEVIFKDGWLSGPWTRYYDNGQIRATGEAVGNVYGYRDSEDDPIRQGLWIYFRRDGTLEAARRFDRGREIGTLPVAWDPFTGLYRIALENPDGSRVVYDVGPEGFVSARYEPVPMDVEEVVHYEYDPDTGALEVVRKQPDGTLVTSTGRRFTDEDGNERLSELDEDGTQRETVISPDGSATITVTEPDGTERVARLDSAAGLSMFETLPDGTAVETTRDPWDGSTVTKYLDAEGNLLGTTIQRADGWIEERDRDGNVRNRHVDETGNVTIFELDRSGNSRMTMLDPHGNVIFSPETLVGPKEPGREYYERVIGGTDWDGLPQSFKNRMADRERELQWAERQRLEQEAVEARRRREEAERAAEGAAAMEELERQLAAIRAEQEAADRRYAEWLAREERRQAIEASRERARELQRAYDAAVARGDMQEAARIRALQDEHHEASMDLLMPTEAEMREMERLSARRHQLSQQILEGARLRAQEELFVNEREQDRADAITGWTQYASIGSQMQYEMREAVRQAERERIWARAESEQIDAMLAAGGWSEEEMQILLDRRELAVLAEQGAHEMLASAGRIATAGYLMDGASLLAGAPAVRAAGSAGQRLFTGVARELGAQALADAAEAGAARVASIAMTDIGTPAVEALGSAARRVMGDSAVESVSSAARRAREVATTDVGELFDRLSSSMRSVPEPRPAPATLTAPGAGVGGAGTATGSASAGAGGGGTAGGGAAGVLDAPGYRSPAERSSRVLENSPSLDPDTRIERIKRPSEMTPAERQAYNDRIADEQWRRLRESGFNFDDDDWDEIIAPPVPDVYVDPRSFTPEEVRRLHEPGRNLTQEELVRKAGLYRQIVRARDAAASAPTAAERVAAEDFLRQVEPIIEDATPTVRLEAPSAGGPPTALASRPGVPVEMPPEAWDFPTVIEPPPRFGRSGPATEIYTLVDFPPLVPDTTPPTSGGSLLPGTARVPSPGELAPTEFFPPPGGLPPTEFFPPPGELAPTEIFPPGADLAPTAIFPPPDDTPTVILPSPSPVPPLRPGASAPPAARWPQGLSVHGLPGPGIAREHLEQAQRLANQTGVPIVLLGSRQTGANTMGTPWSVVSDLDVGIIGGVGEYRRVMGLEDELMKIPHVDHGPMALFPTIEEAVRRGYVVVSPNP